MTTLITIVFGAVDPSGQHIEFIYSDSNLSKCLDQLSFLAASGWRLVSVRCVDRDCSFRLPVEAFDGIPFSAVLRQLQKEWEAILQVN